jgi:tetratricopeptide (TPR) repeat protein
MSNEVNNPQGSAPPNNTSGSSREGVNLLKLIASLLGSITAIITAWLNFKEVLKKGVPAERFGTVLLIGSIALLWICLFYIYTKFFARRGVTAFLARPSVNKWLGRVALFGLIAVPVLALVGIPYYNLYRSKYNLEQSVRLIKEGNFYYENNDINLAIERYEKSLLFNPDNPKTYHNLGEAYLKKNDLDKALENINKSISLEPDENLRVLSYLNQGLIFKRQRNWADALKAYNKVVALRPDYAKAYNNIGTIFIEVTDYDRAITNFDKAIELDANFAFAYNNRGKAYLLKGDIDSALRDIEQSLRLDPTNAHAYLNRARAYAKKNDKDKARADFRTVVTLSREAELIREAEQYLNS